MMQSELGRRLLLVQRSGACRTILGWVSLVLVLLAVAGCADVPVAQDLDQAQANQIVASLHDRGIAAEASRQTGAGGKYQVQVKRGDYSAAIAIMRDQNLPSPNKISLDELLASRGLVPNTREIEIMRLERAQAADIEETLENNPAVISARLVVRTKTLSDESQSVTPSVAAVVLLRPETSLDRQQVLDIIARAVPGVSPDQITLLFYTAEQDERIYEAEGAYHDEGKRIVRMPLTRFLWFWRVPEDEYNGLALVVFGMVVVVLVIGLSIGFLLGWFRRSYQNGEQFASFSVNQSLPRLGMRAPEHNRRE